MSAYREPLDALGDGTRRGILELLRHGPRSVGAIAADLPVSRPAVSQHLRVLEAARLVRHSRNGTKNVYSLDPDGLDALRAWVESFWDDALARFTEVAERRAKEMEMSETLTIAPVRKTVRVACSIELAFEVFTRGAGSWWPTDTHALQPGRVEAIVWEEQEGGAVYEVSTTGEREQWGTILAWDPPARFVLSWEVSRGRAATELEVRFVIDGDGTRIDLEHRHWERLGEEGVAVRDNYDGGWDVVLAPFVARLSSPRARPA